MNQYEVSTASGSVIGTVWAYSEYGALRQAERLYYVSICTVVARARLSMNAAAHTHRTACHKCSRYVLGPVEWRCHCKEPEAYDAWAEIELSAEEAESEPCEGCGRPGLQLCSPVMSALSRRHIELLRVHATAALTATARASPRSPTGSSNTYRLNRGPGERQEQAINNRSK